MTLLSSDELGALRHMCYLNIFELEPIAFGARGDVTEEIAEDAMLKIERNYDLIQKLHQIESETETSKNDSN